MGRAVRLLAATLLVVLLAGCHVAVDVDVVMDANGAGKVTVDVVADKELVSKVPGLAGDLQLTDAQTAGWTVTGPTATSDGGLQVVLTQAFTSPAQANTILASLNGPGGPLTGINLAMSKVKDTTSYTLNGRLQVIGGLEAFSDAQLTGAIGATPYAAQIAQAGVQPGDVVAITFNAALPGKVNNTTATAVGASGLAWAVPMDGTALDVGTLTESTISRNTWAKPLAKSAQVALFTWAAVSVCFIVYVINARRRRRRATRAWR